MPIQPGNSLTQKKKDHSVIFNAVKRFPSIAKIMFPARYEAYLKKEMLDIELKNTRDLLRKEQSVKNHPKFIARLRNGHNVYLASMKAIKRQRSMKPVKKIETGIVIDENCLNENEKKTWPNGFVFSPTYQYEIWLHNQKVNKKVAA